MTANTEMGLLQQSNVKVALRGVCVCVRVCMCARIRVGGRGVAGICSGALGGSTGHHTPALPCQHVPLNTQRFVEVLGGGGGGGSGAQGRP